MLIQFSVKNFLSFRDEAVLSMLASKRRSIDKSLDENATFEAPFDFKLLKSAVIYGANASGKSNIFKALRFMKGMVINSSKESQADEEIDVSPFLLNPRTSAQPSHFEVIFIHNNTYYEYSFSASAKKIETENLIIRKSPHEKERTLFSRAGNEIKVHREFPEGKGLEKRTRDNALFLSVCANFDGAISASVISWFRTVRVISGLSDVSFMPFTSKKLKEKESNEKILKFLDAFDIGIKNIKISDVDANSMLPPNMVKELTATFAKRFGPNVEFNAGSKISTEHTVFDDNGNDLGPVYFDLEKNESDGTKKLVALSAPFIDALENSYILFLDELDARLHPILSLQILKLFNCQIKNSKHAQLVAATHSTNLLDKEHLRRDQIWLTTKDGHGSSSLISLLEYKVRNDASFEKEYIAGKYGGIPLIGELDSIF